MPTFQYKAKTQTGELVTGTLAAGDRRVALTQLGRMGYFPLAVDQTAEVATVATGPKFSLREWRARLTSRDVLTFTQQLSSLLRSGMQLNDAIGTLARRAAKPAVAAMLEQLRREIIEGSTLSDALAKFPRVFSKLYVNLVRAGEASGTLDEVLLRLTKHYEQVGEVRDKVTSALIYPVIVGSVGVGTIIFFMTVMVPRFADMFREMHRTMPLPTRILIAISDLVLHYWWIPLLVGIAGWILLRQQLRTQTGRLAFDRFKLKLPVLGPVITAGAFAQFARTLATLLENGVPVLNALQIVEDTMTNQVIAHEIHEARTQVTDGTSISRPLSKGKVFPPLLLDMLGVGEASGEVVPALKNIADTYERELAQQLKIFTTVLEPIIIVAMALVVGSIVVSVLLAVFDITSGIGR